MENKNKKVIIGHETAISLGLVFILFSASVGLSYKLGITNASIEINEKNISILEAEAKELPTRTEFSQLRDKVDDLYNQFIEFLQTQ